MIFYPWRKLDKGKKEIYNFLREVRIGSQDDVVTVINRLSFSPGLSAASMELSQSVKAVKWGSMKTSKKLRWDKDKIFIQDHSAGRPPLQLWQAIKKRAFIEKPEFQKKSIKGSDSQRFRQNLDQYWLSFIERKRCPWTERELTKAFTARSRRCGREYSPDLFFFYGWQMRIPILIMEGEGLTLPGNSVWTIDPFSGSVLRETGTGNWSIHTMRRRNPTFPNDYPVFLDLWSKGYWLMCWGFIDGRECWFFKSKFYWFGKK